MASSRKLESICEKLRARQIGWEVSAARPGQPNGEREGSDFLTFLRVDIQGYTRAGDLDNAQLQQVLKLAKQPKQTTDQLVQQVGLGFHHGVGV